MQFFYVSSNYMEILGLIFSFVAESLIFEMKP